MSRTPFIAGNWKMFKPVQEAVIFAKELRSIVKDVTEVEIVVGPPFTALYRRDGADLTTVQVADAGEQERSVGVSLEQATHDELEVGGLPRVVEAPREVELGAAAAPGPRERRWLDSGRR